MQEQHSAQQKMLLDLIEQQRIAHEREMKTLSDSDSASKPASEDSSRLKLPKPTLQKLNATDNVEHFLSTFERIATQQEWPKEAWATQLAGLLTGKAMAAYAALTPEDTLLYDKVKEGILRRYEISEETYRQRFRQDRKKGEESYREYADRLRDHFRRWVASQEIPLEELVSIEQFLLSVPDDLRVWLRERKPESLHKAATLADDYVLARKTSRGFSSGRPAPPSRNNPGQQGEPAANSQGQSRLPQPTVNAQDSSSRPGRSQTNSRGDKKCFQRGQFGHLMYSCPERRRSDSKPVLSGAGFQEVVWNKESQKYLRRGILNGRSVQMLIDTGCTNTMVSARYIDPNILDCSNTVEILCVHGDKVCYPTAEVNLRLGQWSQFSRVVVASDIPVPVLLGTDIYKLTTDKPVMVTTRAQTKKDDLASKNEEQIVEPDTQSQQEDIDSSLMVEAPTEQAKEITTERESAEQRAVSTEVSNETTLEGDPHTIEQRREELPSAALRECSPLEATVEHIKQWQAQDPTLQKARETVGEADSKDRVGFYYEDGLLYRKWRPHGSAEGDLRTCKQLVLPQQCRQQVLRLAHDVPMAGHMGIARTKERILQRYYWPGIFTEVANYCRSCEVCQKNDPKHPPRAKIVSMPWIEQPFKRIAMDVVGPLSRTLRGNRYILTICDYATRYPEAVAMPSVEATRIARELVNLFSHVGVPDEILTDQGTNFMSSLLEEIYRLLHIKRIRTTPYHPQTDGVVERFNGTLKSMLRKFVSRSQKDWDEYLPYLLFAYREVPQETTGFSPFDLLYGRHVRGPLDVLREDWTGNRDFAVPVATYVIEMREWLVEMSQLVAKHSASGQQKQKQYYDRSAKCRSFEVGDQVLVLLPTTANKLKLRWTGPYKISKKVSPVDYEVEIPGRRHEKKVYHVNLMKKWHVMTPHPQAALLTTGSELQDEIANVENLEDCFYLQKMVAPRM